MSDNKTYYIVSLKHTDQRDSAMTLWRSDRKGYCWYQNWAGVYTEEDKKQIETFDNVFVEKEKADALFTETIYDGERRMVLPNDSLTLHKLWLDGKVRKKGGRTCYMSFGENQKHFTP